MEVYSQNMICIKCGATDIISIWHQENNHFQWSFNTGPAEEHIECRCKNCKYVWYMSPLNLPSPIVTPASKVNDRPNIITLCGSLRFEEAYHYWNRVLTLQGNLVITVAAFPSHQTLAKKTWYTEEEKEILDKIHLRKIDLADEIFVINQEYLGSTTYYIGDSTKAEIEYAVKNKKRVIYASQIPVLKDCIVKGNMKLYE